MAQDGVNSPFHVIRNDVVAPFEHRAGPRRARQPVVATVHARAPLGLAQPERGGAPRAARPGRRRARVN